MLNLTSHYLKLIQNPWVRPSLIISIFGLIAWLLPLAPLDPWNLLSPKKFATMLFALALIQVFGSVLALFLGFRMGSILTGFLGGLVSSTATTASIARKSKIARDENISAEILIFLSSTNAMLVEVLILVLVGTKDIHLSNLILLSSPIFVNSALIFFQTQQTKEQKTNANEISFKILPILKLSVLIIAILAASRFLQHIYGQNGLVGLTFLVSLFEIHGSVIANIQLHDNAVISENILINLIAISLIASYLSKFFLISILGSKNLRKRTLYSTLILLISILVGWLLSTLTR